MSFSLHGHGRGLVMAASGVTVLSFDSLLVRLAATDGWNIIFWRGALMGLSLGLLCLDGRRLATLRGYLGVSLFSAILLGITSSLFVLAVMNTKVANVVVILSAAPLFAALFTHFFLHDPVAVRTWLAILSAMAGMLIVFSASLTGDGLVGDVYAVIAAAAVGGNLTLLRRHPNLDRIPLIAMGGGLSAFLAWPMATPLALTTQSYGILALMGLLQMPLATALINNATRHLPSAEVALFYLVEAVFGTLWVWWWLGEQPPQATLLGGFVILLTLFLNAWSGLRESNRRMVRPLGGNLHL
ncbi:DMT family transporter [Billgrantia pellis]|uniref:DMT family transporter n=2 Tax=Billgrantia pellis TaxID=2606936 RepID=A0A7V7FZ71_9GAMM|nr:DMT family transporter [Halomonas pellis]